MGSLRNITQESTFSYKYKIVTIR